MSWRNAYSPTPGGAPQAAGYRERLAEENRRRVLRRRTEDSLMKELHKQSREVGHVDPSEVALDRLDEFREEVEAMHHERQQQVEAGLHLKPETPKVSRLAKPVKDPEPYRSIRTTELGAKCACVTHSGATIWAGDADGSIRVCDGATGEVVHAIPGDREEGASPIGAVSAMIATNTHVWAGYANGTVRVFDHTAFIQITEGNFHSGPVSCFTEAGAAGVSQRMVSGGDDGCLVVWDTEERNFDAMCKVVLPVSTVAASDSSRGGISCITMVGPSHAYCGTLSGNVVVVNIVTAEVSHVIAAHQDAVLGICCVLGSGAVHDQTPFVFTCSADCSMAVWRRSGGGGSGVDPADDEDGAEDGQHDDDQEAELVTRNPTASPVLCIVADRLNKRVWTGEQDGTVSVWFATLDDGFALERKLPALPAPVLRLHTTPAIDALKVWSLGSNGVNKVWYSSTHRGEADLHRTVQTLKAIAQQDGVELDKWRETVAKLQHSNTRRKLQLARIMTTTQQDALRRRYIWQWRRVMLKNWSARRREAIANRLEREFHEDVGRRFFERWTEWTMALQKRRVKTAYSRLLMANANRTSVQLYWAKMQAFARIVKAGRKARDLVKVLGIQTQRSALRDRFRKWLKWLRGQQQANRKVAYVAAMMRMTDQSLVRVYYAKWVAALERRETLNHRRDVAQVLFQQAASSRVRAKYMVWRRWVLWRQTQQRRMSVASMIVGVSEEGLTLVYFRKWRHFLDHKVFMTNEKRRQEAEDDLAQLRATYSDMEEIIKEKKELDALEAEIEEEIAKLQEQDVMIERLRLTVQTINEEIENQAEREAEERKSFAEQFATLIAKLKAQVINFHQDAALIQQLKDKSKNIPTSKIFLEAHAEVKRVVVALTGKPHLSGDTEPWPLTPQKLSTLAGHQMTAAHSAIKTMVITFDMMDRETRDGLQSDREIVTNAMWLMTIAEMANKHRIKTLGRGAVRAK